MEETSKRQEVGEPAPAKKNPNKKFQHFPKFSQYHPMIPKQYVPGWKTDMENRTQMVRHAEQSLIYSGPHDESLFLQRRERLNHGETRCCVERKTEEAEKKRFLHPLFYHHMSKYQSGLMYRHEGKYEKCFCKKI